MAGDEIIRARGHSRTAHSAATAEINPSMTTGRPGRRPPQKRAAHGGKVKAAHLGKHVHRVVPVGTVHFDCLTDDCFLPQEALVGHAAAPCR